VAFAYSNFGYCILGRVIEKITQQSYSDYVRDTVLSACGIRDMRIGGNTLKDRAVDEVTYYGENAEYPYAMNVTRMDSHGGWIATPTDLVRFATRVDGFASGRNILSSETIRRMTTPSKANPRYARGWFVNERGNWWHTGSLPGTTAVMVRTSTDFCWAALVNIRLPEGALDDFIWQIVSNVSAWRTAARAPAQ
jgi:CubicO group peptidase (beta-lactamase class C family)